jgi:hypothetical protein
MISRRRERWQRKTSAHGAQPAENAIVRQY